jgi:hypothetical protein
MDGDRIGGKDVHMLSMGSAAERLEAIDRMVAERCGVQQMQDIVSNLLMIMRTIDDRAATGCDAGVRALAGECLRIAGISDGDIAMAVSAIGDLVGGVGAPELLAAVADDQKVCASNVSRPRG